MRVYAIDSLIHKFFMMQRVLGITSSFILVIFLSSYLQSATASCFGSKQKYYTDCVEAFTHGETCSGVYNIKPDDLPSFDVYCDMDTDGGGWVVFQRRMDGTENFYRGWSDYVKGFGDLNGEFWLGLNKIHRLTKSTEMNTTLRVDLADFDGNKRFAEYSEFKVLDFSRSYRLRVTGYSGDAGDSLAYHNQRNFSARDRADINGCAAAYKGGWWYHNCHVSNLNGLYLPGSHSSYADGVNWKNWKGYHYSLMSTEMKLRQNGVNCGPPQESANTDIQFTATTYGSTAIYKCNSGYELSTGAQSLTRECLTNGIWAGSTPTCNPVDCGGLSQIPNGQVDAPITTYGSVATYRCDRGYMFSLEEETVERTCQSDRTWSGATPTCVRTRYTDCQDALTKGETNSTVYTVQPDNLSPFDVYCDMETDGGGWTVFQRRQDGSEDFYRGWRDYEVGFGNLNGEFWLGLEKIHRLSRNTPTLRIDLEDFEGNSRFAKYSTFQILDSSTSYQLNVTSYSGDATDSLINHVESHQGRKFTTKDRDNDLWSGNCAIRYKGGWWYHSCHRSNLNGPYLSGVHTSYADGVEWVTWKGFYYSLKFTEMKLRKK